MDLEGLRKRVEEARANPEPRDPAAQHLVDAQEAARRGGFVDGGVVVTPDGVIRRADQVRQTDGPVSRVTSQIFAASSDEELARRHLPKSQRRIDFDGTAGWVYDVTTRGQAFTFYLHRNRYSGGFSVRLVSPEIERLGMAHATHLYSDGRLCLGPYGHDPKTLEDAYGRSVMWAEGITQMLEGHAWPWGE